MANSPDKRFLLGYTQTHVWVIDMPIEKFKNLENGDEQERHTIAKIRIGGMVSKQLARVWAEQICDQLNQFDVANAAVAKLT